MVIALLAGAALNAAAVWWYARAGYRPGVVVLWLGALLLPAALLWEIRARRGPVESPWREATIVLGLLVICGPLYLADVAHIPFQINTDEVTIMFYTRDFLAQASPDLFGISGYFGFPSMIFIVLGWIGHALGGVTLPTMRLVHASCGLLSVVLAYAWLRVSWSRVWAALGALILGANHSLIGISRLAMRDNTCLLLELAAFVLLAGGLRRRCAWRTFLGGVIAGLCWYTYYPSRVTPIVWDLFLIVLLLRFRRRVAPRLVLGLGTVALAGSLFAVSPLLIATRKQSDTVIEFTRRQLLLYPEGRATQQTWVHTGTVEEAIRINVRQGLGMFNNHAVDLSTTYVNPGHGFLDPLTGVLVWIGMLSVWWSWRRPVRARDWLASAQPMQVFAATGFIALWLAFAFIVNKAPNYTRALVILPFVAFLAAQGARAICLAAERLAAARVRQVRGLSQALAAVVVSIILGWNAIIYAQFLVKGWTEGNLVGGTARQVMARSDRAGYTFYLVTSPQYQYYDWGEPQFWKDWIAMFTGPQQQTILLSPEQTLSMPPKPPFTMFLDEAWWKRSQGELTRLYPSLQVVSVLPNHSRLAIVVD